MESCCSPRACFTLSLASLFPFLFSFLLLLPAIPAVLPSAGAGPGTDGVFGGPRCAGASAPLEHRHEEAMCAVQLRVTADEMSGAGTRRRDMAAAVPRRQRCYELKVWALCKDCRHNVFVLGLRQGKGGGNPYERGKQGTMRLLWWQVASVARWQSKGTWRRAGEVGHAIMPFVLLASCTEHVE